jgi:hypothetical protein
LSERFLIRAPGKELRLAQDLEAVADPRHRAARARERAHLAHDGALRGDGAGAQVVAVAEAAGKEDGVHPLQVVLACHR